jgi:Sec1 family
VRLTSEERKKEKRKKGCGALPRNSVSIHHHHHHQHKQQHTQESKQESKQQKQKQEEMSDPSSSSFSLKAAQLRAVYRMLAFNDESAAVILHPRGSGGGGEDNNNNGDDDDDERYYQLPPPGSSHNGWKVLVYDASCQKIISPLLNVQQLRRRGVTLHLMLHSDREVIPDVPAVYFCRPTRDNLVRIARDCSQNLYGSFHINVVTRLERPLMEEFAKLVVQTGSLHHIASIHDQYLDYVVLERNLFSLAIPDSYQLYNGAAATEAQMEAAMGDVALGLFSVVASLGHVPIIRCPKVCMRVMCVCVSGRVMCVRVRERAALL